jgi:5'-deoxynucleotidase YfbR-like HD superfamily hydrolase
VSQAWIETFTGKHFDILEPQSDEIDIVDIAHSLSLQCRFTGHTKHFYSVAQHSFYASQLVPPEDALWALLHDASEAYISDMSRPLKHYTDCGHHYKIVEDKIMAAICMKFRLPFRMPLSVRKADDSLLYAEKEQLMADAKWDTLWSSEDAAKIKIDYWPPELAKTRFLARYYTLSPV